MKDYLRFIDKTSIIVLLLITILGIILINSASQNQSKPVCFKQCIWMLISLTFFIFVLRIKTEFVFDISIIIYIFLVFILILQLLIGVVISGARSWFKIGFISIQVSEFIKVPLAIIIARLLSRISVLDWKNFLKLFLLLAIPFSLIALQPDIGTAFILVSYIIMIIFLKKIKASIVIFSLIFLFASGFVTWNYVLKPYQKNRIISFFNPEKYPKSSGYQIIQSKIAIGSGGISGKGYLKGSQSQYKFLPTRETDFIISVLGEEFGFLGISTILLLFFILFFRQFNFKALSKEEFYFVYLFNGLILFQFLINVLMSMGFFPILGVPLPFVSYGGSSLLTFFIGEALIFKIKINPYLQQ